MGRPQGSDPGLARHGPQSYRAVRRRNAPAKGYGLEVPPTAWGQARTEESTMNRKTLTALKKSIKHWEENVAAETAWDASTRASECALCAIFLYNGTQTRCTGCPVREKTKRSYCNRSPYTKAHEAFSGWFRSPNSPEAKKRWSVAAKAELTFLRSLLPVS